MTNSVGVPDDTNPPTWLPIAVDNHPSTFKQQTKKMNKKTTQNTFKFICSTIQLLYRVVGKISFKIMHTLKCHNQMGYGKVFIV